MSEWKSLTNESKKRWDTNAVFWDNYMGDNNNRFHNELIKPCTKELLQPKKGERILDIACGHGNFSRQLAEIGVEVTAFDYSSELIEKAKKRTKEGFVHYKVIDATDADALTALGENRYDAAVCNMALMDISAIKPLSHSLFSLLKVGGRFVYSVMHPCFQNPGLIKVFEEKEIGNKIISTNSIKISHYIQPESYEGIGIRNQPVSQIYFHRPLSVLLNTFFNEGFVMDRIEEPVFKVEEKKQFDWHEIPPIIICRLRK